MNPNEIVAVAMMALGTWLFYLSRKRAFDRRNAFGREVFASFSGSLVTRLIDWSLIAIGFVLAGTGILYLAIEYRDTWGWIVVLPVAWFFVVGYVPLGKR